MTVTNSVTMSDITMSFGANLVLKGVDLHVPAASVTALLGANGAGKSTLIRVLSGLYPDHGGTVSIDGVPQRLDSPATARRIGIETVHQRIDEGVIPGLTVAENLLFERIVSGELRPVASLRSLLRPAREVAAALSLDWPDSFLRTDVFEVGIADKQLITLARALSRQPRLLVLDEPTSALSQTEVDRLFDVITSLRDSGVGILYVSHRLGEIDALADHLSVLRDGRIRGQQEKPFDWQRALTDMLGEQTVMEMEALTEMRGPDVALELNDVQIFPRSGSFSVSMRSGEVTGVIGLLGSGKTELAKAIFGAEPLLAGTMRLDGVDFTPASPHSAIAKGVFLVPEDRSAESMLPGWSIARTVSLPFLGSVTRRGILQGARERRQGSRVISDFGVVATGEAQSVDSLSGGNQQKVVVGRWLQASPRVLVLDEPFRGVDIGARRDISRKARDVAATGSAVVVLTSDIDEVFEVADRILVLVDGELRMDTYASITDREQILTKMSEVA